jgi:prepilin-type N-terminal cleavage/methylation domain-containing protein
MRLSKSGKIRNENGFTLIEVVVSIALLAAVSVSLLQMFTVSSRTNRIAYELDSANALCVKATEMYKGDPRHGDDDGTYLNTGFDVENPEIDKYVYTQFYDSLFQNPPFDAKYKLEITSIKGNTRTMPISFYPDAAYEEVIPNASTVDVILTWDSINNEVDITIASSSGSISATDTSIIYSSNPVTNSKTAMIPIHLDCSNIQISPANATIKVRNDIGRIPLDNGMGVIEEYEAIADIYLCDIQEGETVDIGIVSGMSTQSRITKKNQTITEYSGIIRVMRSSDNSLLAENCAEKFWFGN